MSFREEDKYGILKNGQTPDHSNLEIPADPPLYTREQRSTNEMKKVFDRMNNQLPKIYYDAVFKGGKIPNPFYDGAKADNDEDDHEYFEEEEELVSVGDLREQGVVSKDFWEKYWKDIRIKKVNYLVGEPPSETWKKILPIEPPSKRVFPHLVPDTRRGLSFPTQRAMVDFESYLGQLRSYIDINPPPGLIGAEMDPDPITRKIRHNEMGIIGRNRITNERLNPPPIDKPRYHIHGIQGDIWLDATKCMARKLNKLDDSIPLTITNVPIRHWKAHLNTQAIRTHGSNVDFESGSTVYVTQARPNSFNGLDPMGGSWEFANHLKEKYNIDVNPCWRKVLSTKNAVANKMKMKP